MCSPRCQHSEPHGWLRAVFMLSPRGHLALGVSEVLGKEIKILPPLAYFTESSKLNIWGPCLDAEFCVHLMYHSLAAFLPIFSFLSFFLSFFSSPLFERGCQALLEHEDGNESSLSTEATPSGIFKWDEWHWSKHQFPDTSECQEPCRAVTQKSDLPATILLSCHPASHPQHLLMYVYFLQEMRKHPHPHCLGPQSKEVQVFP